MMRAFPILLAGAAVPALAAGPLIVTSELAVERQTAAADGTTRVTLTPAARAVPGDRLRVTVSYRNTGSVAIGNLAITNPVPAGLAYRGAAGGSPSPDVSADGAHFAPLSTLLVAGRPAVAADITFVRWRLASPVAAGSGGQFAFEAVLK